jgi:Ribonuclease G/E
MTKTICPRCHGNGYIKVKESIENPVEIIQQCPSCNSQGEITMSTERLILETKLVKELNRIIKKLNGEIDVLQSKLKEKEGVKDEKSNVRSTREEIRS